MVSADLEKVANVVSALSPNSKWKQNKIGAETMIKNFVLGNSVESFKVVLILIILEDGFC